MIPGTLNIGRLVDLDQQMNPFDFGVSGSKVKVTLTLSWQRFLINIFRRLGPRDLKPNRLVGHEQQMNPIHFEVSGSKVKVSVTFS